MATIQSTIQLIDAFTSPMMNVINSVNTGVSAVEDLQQVMNEGFDTSGIQAMENSLNRTTVSAVDLASRFDNILQGLQELIDQQNRFNQSLQQGANNASGLKNAISNVVGAYVGIAGIKKAFSFVQDAAGAFDTQLNAERQLASVLANTGGISAFDTIAKKASEIQGRGIYGDEIMIAASAEFSTYFKDSAAIETMMDTLANYAMGMSGGGALDSSAMVNYATNLGKVMTGAYDAMTKKGFEFSEAQKAIIEGEATREQIIATLGAEYVDMTADMQAAAAISQVIDESWAGLYDSMSNTPQGKIIQLTNSWGDLQEQIGGRLYPAVENLVDIINDNWDTVETIMFAITDGLTVVIGLLSETATIAFAVVDSFGGWDGIGTAITAVAAALVAYKAAAASAALAQGALNGAMSMNPAGAVALAFGALVVAVGLYTDYVNNAYGLSLSFAGMLGGTLMVILAALGNMVISFVNRSIGEGVALWNFIVDFVNFFANVWDDPIGAVVRLWAGMFDTILSLVENFARTIDGVFKTDLASGLKSFRSELEAAVAEQFGTGVEVISKINADDAYLDYIDYYEAFDAGYYLGEGLLSGSISADYSAYNAINEMLANTDAISESAGAIADSMEISEENLKYLRDIAEQETVNRFTTAEIKIEQTNHNNISGDMDLDGIISGLTDALNEAVEVMAEGVYE